MEKPREAFYNLHSPQVELLTPQVNSIKGNLKLKNILWGILGIILTGQWQTLLTELGIINRGVVNWNKCKFLWLKNEAIVTDNHLCSKCLPFEHSGIGTFNATRRHKRSQLTLSIYSLLYILISTRNAAKV